MNIKQDKKQVFFKHGHEILTVDLADILFIERTQRKSIIHCPNRYYEVSVPLIILEKCLNNHFFRSHRSYIINIDWVDKIVSWKAKSYSIIFRDSDKQASLSRKRKKELFLKLHFL